MSDLPPTIDAILATIRARVTADDADHHADRGEDDVPPVPMVPMPLIEPPLPISEMGDIAMPPATSALTLDALMRQMLEPMLKAWLDAHMPEIVERLARAEIKRLTGDL
jgi:hypothetical protein